MKLEKINNEYFVIQNGFICLICGFTGNKKFEKCPICSRTKIKKEIIKTKIKEKIIMV
jgi:rubrerythrin